MRRLLVGPAPVLLGELAVAPITAVRADPQRLDVVERRRPARRQPEPQLRELALPVFEARIAAQTHPDAIDQSLTAVRGAVRQLGRDREVRLAAAACHELLKRRLQRELEYGWAREEVLRGFLRGCGARARQREAQSAGTARPSLPGRYASHLPREDGSALAEGVPGGVSLPYLRVPGCAAGGLYRAAARRLESPIAMRTSRLRPARRMPRTGVEPILASAIRR